MNKKKIIIIVLIVILLVVAGIIISNIFNKNEEEKNNNTNTANLEVPNVEIDKNQVDYDEDATVNELKDFTGASGDSDLYEVATEYDGRKVLKIKDNKQYDVAMAGIIKQGKPEFSEIDSLKEKAPNKSGIWISESSRNNFLDLLEDQTNSRYKINEEGYLEIELAEFTVEDISEEQVHISYTRKLILDMQVEKKVKNIIVNGVKDAVGEEDAIQKIEIVASKLQTEQIQIEYTIRITNTGEIAGNIGKILEEIPKNFLYESSQNTVKWEQEGEYLVCKDYENVEIGVGESVEIPILLKWQNGSENLGEKVNTVRLENITNTLGYADKTEENNTSSVTTVMSVKTGNEAFYENLKMISILVSVIGIVGIVIILEIKYLRRKSK